MNPAVLAVALIVVGFVGGKLLMRRIPEVTKQQVFCAVAAWVGAVSVVANEMRAPLPGLWYYASLVIAVVMGTFLLLALFRHWDSQRPTHSV